MTVSQRLLAILDASDDPLTTSTLVASVGKTRQAVWNVLTSLLDAGLVTKSTVGRVAWWSAVR